MQFDNPLRLIPKKYILETIDGLFLISSLLAFAYLLWRISDQLPDVLYRLSEIQKDIAD